MPVVIPKFKARGVLFQKHMCDPADYFDFKSMEWFPADIRRELEMGQIPEGLILQTDNGPLGVVVGIYGQPQEVVLLEELI